MFDFVGTKRVEIIRTQINKVFFIHNDMINGERHVVCNFNYGSFSTECVANCRFGHVLCTVKASPQVSKYTCEDAVIAKVECMVLKDNFIT